EVQLAGLLLQRRFRGTVTQKQKMNVRMCAQEVSCIENMFEPMRSSKGSGPKDDSLPLKPEALLQSLVYLLQLKGRRVHAVRQEKHLGRRHHLDAQKTLLDPLRDGVHV